MNSQAMLARYHDLETSARLFQELMAVCQAYGHKNRRLLVFGRLCGLEMAQEECHVVHNDVREGFFFRLLTVLVNRRLEMLINSFATEVRLPYCVSSWRFDINNDPCKRFLS